MEKLSLCMIVRNEEEVLDRCLDSIREAADEIILVDTGSEDRTKEKGANYTEKIYDFPWKDDFSAARNYAVSKASGDYWMWLDADDVLSREACEKLKALKQELPSETDVVMMPYASSFDQEGRPLLICDRERILKNIPAYRFRGRVHEAVVPCGRVRREEILVEHRPMKRKSGDRNLRIYERMRRQGAVFSGRDLYYYGRELLEKGRLEEADKIFCEFLQREDGWVEDRIEATRRRADCLRGMGKNREALLSLLSGLQYAAPRAETCCELGSCFMEQENYSLAAWWFEQALRADRDQASGAFVRPDCRGYLPAINLCVCYDKMGQREKARAYNRLAGSFRPEDPFYLRNVAYFQQQHIV